MLRELAAYPGAGLEFTAGLDPRDDWADHFADWRKGASPLLVHNYFPPPEKPFVLNLAAQDEDIRDAGLALCREAMRLSAIAGAPFFSVHGGFAMSLRPEQLGDHSSQARESAPADRETAAQVFISNVRTLADEAAALGLRLLLENNVVSEAHRRSGLSESLFLSTPADIESFFAHWTDLPVGLLLDTGHARVTGNTLGVNPDEFFALSHRIEALHLSDNDGLADSNKPFSAGAWFAPHLPVHAAKPMVIEVYGLDESDRRAQWDTLNSLLQK